LFAFNSLLKLAESLNHPFGYCIKLPIEDSEDLPGQNLQIVYDDNGEHAVSEVVAIHEME